MRRIDRTSLQRRLSLAAAALAGVMHSAAPARAEEPVVPAGLSVRTQFLAAIERLPDAQLRYMVVQCDRDASRRILDVGEAMSCSMALDTLRERHFGGDFERLLTWWRAERDRGAAR